MEPVLDAGAFLGNRTVIKATNRFQRATGPGAGGTARNDDPIPLWTYAVRWSSRPWSEAEELALSPDVIGTEGAVSRPHAKLGAPLGLDMAFGLLDQQISPQLCKFYDNVDSPMPAAHSTTKREKARRSAWRPAAGVREILQQPPAGCHFTTGQGRYFREADEGRRAFWHYSWNSSSNGPRRLTGVVIAVAPQGRRQNLKCFHHHLQFFIGKKLGQALQQPAVNIPQVLRLPLAQ
jgi:hypothetical protein